MQLRSASTFALALLLAASALLCAQNSTPQQPSSSQQTPAAPQPNTPELSNPFPEDTPSSQQSASPSTKTAQPNKPEQNPFPGTGANAPIIPVGPDSASPDNASPTPLHATDSPTVADIDPNGDPMRSPEWPDESPDPATASAQQNAASGFSSSTSGVQDWNAATDDATPASRGRKHRRGQPQDDAVAVQTPDQRMKEDLNVGSFYLDQKNWLAAESRFAEAFQINPEETRALWGLAVSEQHLQEYAKARQHFELYLSYGMDGREAKAARKAIKEMPDSAQNH